MTSGHLHPHRPVSRRSLLAGAGGLLTLAAAPGPASASAAPASRLSRVSRGTTLVHADLHNHTLLSDGMGVPELAFDSMRTAGLDVAALTDHATDSGFTGITGHKWKKLGKLADQAYQPGSYTTLRGFEWSHSHIGHINVWFTDEFADLSAAADEKKLYEWLAGTSGIGSFNHPGRQREVFGDFAYDARLADHMVALEMFNSGDDYVFGGWPDHPSPLVACLNAGWRTGLTGTPDEHGSDWGHDDGKGRTGLWVTGNTRDGVLAAMRARRFFASRVDGLRLDATADGVRMGGRLPLAKGDVTFRLDLDGGQGLTGRPLSLQVLRPGPAAPEVVGMLEVRTGQVVKFVVPLDVSDGDWVVLRLSDPARDNETPGPVGHACNDFGLAYSSPWWLTGGSTSVKASTRHPSGR
ncbi:CehA/McbA family metallohydrolase [Actinoplanes sp. LDG1-06]|uniref:CehA/McbA family metallohydrolase n=1 Tax=Paractinoplanes ovalisporus TaxID=2810368 RepID=A0ABS2AEJ1_9ACTN|nr:CehA/McbA family metallohydrolase [Actinoplanes ovalisporus]MBM2618250.1 CehA/McbA family metallohydrolase [Actinoplanes ovalisporus]